MSDICFLCRREIKKGWITRHHTVPKNYGRKKRDKCELLIMHRKCHSLLHSMFHEWYLAQELYSSDKINKHPVMEPLRKWFLTLPEEWFVTISGAGWNSLPQDVKKLLYKNMSVSS